MMDFDFRGFYRAVDLTREARRMSWKEVAEETGVGASTLARMAKDRRPDADGLASLAAWASLNPGEFVKRLGHISRPTSEPLARISKLLRDDQRLSATSADTLEQILRAAYAQLVKR
jgi:transcriptional regulator with XRE-family HTH domain